ncbi:MAG: U32 family peptidase [Tyzzerella sp.]|nr:U32 family peptidase [Tyzzerella sp.]
MTKKVEILSPAGSYESLKAAIAAGADAVYIGGSRFGARAFADNLQEDKLLEAIDYVHLHGRKIYLTVNTLLKEKELQEELYEYLLPYYRQGLDAVIVQDIGVLQFVKEHFPDLPIHASTQMTITNVLGAKMLEELGVERVVTARELQLDEIAEISRQTNVEIESFVHGALCYCYSGQCLYSSLLGGRSGNRGQCAQPCRLPYKVGNDKETQYVMSLKDMCALEYIPELVEAGIYSFKIEGRMKKPEYVALVTAMYRKYVDLYLDKGEKGFRVEPKDREMLMDLYNRGGSHGGYYHTKNGRDMLSLTRPNHAGVAALQVLRNNGKNTSVKALVDIHKGDVIEFPNGEENYTFSRDVKAGQNVNIITHKKQFFQKDAILNRTRNEQLITDIHENIIRREVKEMINGKLILSSTDFAKMSVSYGDIIVEVTGDVAQEAINQPMDVVRIEKQMRKTGNTPFKFETLDIKLCGNLFIPMQSLNELRRKALEELERRIVQLYRRDGGIEPSSKSQKEDSKIEKKCLLHVYVENHEQFKEALEHSCIHRIYLDCNAINYVWKNDCFHDFIEKAHQMNKEIYFAMPHIFRKETVRKYEENYKHIFEANWDGVLIRNYESFEFLREHGFRKNIVTDYNLYQFNQYAKGFWLKNAVETTTAPLELNYRELQDVGVENSELIIYGHLPMMVSAQCIRKTTEGCKKEKGLLTFKDRYQKTFFVKNHCDYCYNMIYNTAPLVLTDQKSEIESLNPKSLRLHFTIENRKTMKDILRLYEDVFVKGAHFNEPNFEFTRGHFKRGIK